MYQYKIFGYAVHSEIELNAFGYESIVPEIVIREVETLEAYENIYANYLDTKFSYFQFLFNEQLKYLITSDSIIVYCHIDYREHLKLYLLGSAFAILMFKRHSFPLHGSTVCFEGNTISFIGDSGAGKSSIALGFIMIGGQIITDDVSRIVIEGERCKVYSSYPSQKLWKDTLVTMNQEITDENIIVQGYDKYYVKDSSQFISDYRYSDAIIVIEKYEGEQVTIERKNQSESLKYLLNYTFKPELIHTQEQQIAQFKLMNEIALRTKVFVLKRPSHGFTIEIQRDAIINALRGEQDEI